MDVLVEGNRLPSIAGIFHEREIPYTVAVADVNAIIEYQEASLAKAFCKSKFKLRLSHHPIIIFLCYLGPFNYSME